MPWLLAKSFLGLARWAWIAILLVLAVAVYFAVAGAERADDKANQTIGGNVVRIEAAEKNAQRTEQGNAAREEVRRPDAVGDRARYDQCVRSARASAVANCRRFLPEQPTDIDSPGS